MALKAYSDAACTVEVKFNQAFAGTGAQTAFVLTNFTGAQLGGVYLETKLAQTGVTFASGVGSGFSGLTVNGRVGQRVVHNGAFRGTVAANDATTITLSDLTYTEATASTCVVSSYAKLAGSGYSVVGDTINILGSIPTAAQAVIAVPASAVGITFTGAAGASKTAIGAFWLKRTPGFNYSALLVKALDLSQTQVSLTQTGVTFAAGVGSGFSGLVAGALKGQAVTHGGTYRGVVTSNTTTTVTISDTGYTEAVAADAVVFTIGSTEFAPDSSGSPGTFARAIHPADITTDTAVKLYFRETLLIPADAMNYPNNVISITRTETVA